MEKENLPQEGLNEENNNLEYDEENNNLEANDEMREHPKRSSKTVKKTR